MTALRVGWLTAANAGDARGQHPQHRQVAAAGQQRLHGEQRAGHRRAGRR